MNNKDYIKQNPTSEVFLMLLSYLLVQRLLQPEPIKHKHLYSIKHKVSGELFFYLFFSFFSFSYFIVLSLSFIAYSAIFFFHHLSLSLLYFFFIPFLLILWIGSVPFYIFSLSQLLNRPLSYSSLSLCLSLLFLFSQPLNRLFSCFIHTLAFFLLYSHLWCLSTLFSSRPNGHISYHTLCVNIPLPLLCTVSQS